MKNEDIDILLNTIYSTNEYRILQEEQFLTYDNFIEYRSMLSYLVTELKLVRQNFTNDGIYSLTSEGNEIMDQGGWIEYLENKKNDEGKILLREQKQDELLNLELSLKKFEAKVEKRILVAGLIFTILNFIVSVLAARFF